MAIIHLISEDEASDKVKKIYEEIKKHFGIPFVPNLFKAMASNPDYLETTWKQFKVIMGPGELKAREKEMIALAVSTVNNCEYCIYAHKAALINMGLSEKGFVELISVIGLYSSLNKFLDGLMVEPDLGV